MYKIIKGADVIGIVEKPRYIKKIDGIYVEADETDAQGVAFHSVPYNLPGGEMEGLETVLVTEVDGGEYILSQQNTVDTMSKNSADTDAMLVDQEYRLTLLELGLTETAV